MIARLRASKLALGAAAVASGAVLLGGIALASFGGVSPSFASAIAPFGATLLAQNGGPIAKLGDILDGLVKNGTITTDQKSKILAAVEDAAKQGKGHRVEAFGRPLLEDAAAAIGISAADLKKDLPGKSLAQVAQAHNVSRDTLVQKLTTAADARVDTAQRGNKITKDQADKLKANVPAMVGKFVDEVRRAPQPGAHGGKAALGNLLQEAAKAIGITPDQLKTELPGKSLTQVASLHGVDRNTLIQKLTASADARVAALIGTFVDRVTPTR